MMYMYLMCGSIVIDVYIFIYLQIEIHVMLDMKAHRREHDWQRRSRQKRTIEEEETISLLCFGLLIFGL